MHGESGLPPILMSPLTMKGMLAIEVDQEPHPASLSPIIKSTNMNVGIKIRLVKAWEATLRARH